MFFNLKLKGSIIMFIRIISVCMMMIIIRLNRSVKGIIVVRLVENQYKKLRNGTLYSTKVQIVQLKYTLHFLYKS